MTDCHGRLLAPNEFSEDDGSADPALVALLAAANQGSDVADQVHDALASARVHAAIVAVLGEAEEVPSASGGLRRDKASDMALGTLVAPDGTKALPVFTS